MLIGTDGVYSYTFEYEKRDDCPVCGGEALELSISPELTVEQLIELLLEKQDVYVFLHSFLMHPIIFNPQPNQETIIIDTDVSDILAGTTSAGGGDSTQPGKESLGAGSARRRGHCHRQLSAIQLISAYHVHIIASCHLHLHQ